MPAPLPVTVLFVEKDNDVRSETSDCLRRAGFRVREAANGSDAMRFVYEHPDVVLLDSHAADSGSFEITQELKDHAAIQSIPVVDFCNRCPVSDSNSEARNGESDGHLTPMTPAHDLIANLKALARVHRAETETYGVLRQLHAVLHGVSDGICLINGDGKIEACNRAVERILNRRAADIVGRTAWEVTPSLPGLENPQEFLRFLDSGVREVMERNAAARWCQVTLVSVKDELDRLRGAVYVVVDLTTRKKLEEQLCRAQRLQTVGELACGVGHDINNVLTTILGNVSLLLDGNSSPRRAAEVLKIVEKSAVRAASLVHQILGYSKTQLPATTPIDVRCALKETVAMLAGTLGNRIKVNIDLANDLSFVRMDATHLNQVLINLCLNARDAMTDGGVMSVSAANVVIDDHPSGRAGNFVRLQVRDSGHGIPPDVIPRVFEPFFTTKPPDSGTGLGLATVDRIVRDYKGRIECTSMVGKGSTFTVYLPCATPSA